MQKIRRLSSNFVALCVVACLGDGTEPTEPGAPAIAGTYVLQSVAGRILPAPLPFCDPTCSETKLVIRDTLEITSGSELRFNWIVYFAEDEAHPEERAVITGTIALLSVGYALLAENHPVLPSSVTAGAFRRAPDGSYELYAYPPWESAGLALFTHAKVVQ